MNRALSVAVAVAATALTLSAAATATAATEVTGGRWAITAEREVPLRYFQGLTHNERDDFLFVGIFKGGYRTDGTLREMVSNESLIPAAVEQGVGFNHIGDPTFDTVDGGRLLVPLECYDPAAAAGAGNTCGMGGIGVVDPKTLLWKHWVRLDPADIPKAMWAEVSPDGKRLWTSSGNDLLAYSTADLGAAHAATDAASTPIRPVARLVGAVPRSGITGAAFVDGRLFLAGEADKVLQIASVDLKTGKSRVELTLPGVHAEPEGLDLLDDGKGYLHFLLSPFGDNGDPTYGQGHSELVSFVPRSGLKLSVDANPGKVRVGRTTTVSVTAAQIWGTEGHFVKGATVKVDGRTATTASGGHAKIKVTPKRTGKLKITVTKPGLRAGSATVTVTR